MVENAKIKEFVQKTLGCMCPDEVFEHIEVEENFQLNPEVELRAKVNVGNRLLFYIIETKDPDFISRHLETIVQRGKAERDERSFNRFRLVIETGSLEEIQTTAEEIFNNIEDMDDRVHLHIIKNDDRLIL